METVAQPLALQKNRPLVSKIKLGNLPLIGTAYQMRKALPKLGDGATPDSEAIKFYLHNHAYMLVQQRKSEYEPLGKYQPVVEAYFSVGTEVFQRLFYYLLVICTREARHVHNSNNIFNKVEQKFGIMLAEYLQKLKASGGDGAIDLIKDTTMDISLGQYTTFLEFVFDMGGFSGGYGGQPWVDVAGCLNRFVHGKTSGETMVDTGFTLAHNNGPIFNKPLLYSKYSANFGPLLDVQRGGMIPQLVWEARKGCTYMKAATNSPAIQGMHKHLEAIVGNEFSGRVDWDQVKNLGAEYPVDTFKQKALMHYGTAPKVVAVDLAKDEKQDVYFVTPSQTVPKLTRKQLVLGS